MKDKIINGYKITKEEALELFDLPLEKLSNDANIIRKHFLKDEFDLCTIINGKSGKCSEDCKFCAQSAHYNTNTKVFSLIDKDTALEDAVKNRTQGVNRYSIVTSGKRATKKEVDTLCEIYEHINSNSDIKLCASHGLLEYDDFIKLKKSGVIRYHNNLETSRNYFKNICTTHTYDEKIQTIKEAKRAGLEVCSGGIIGLGESKEDLIDMAFELRNLGIKSIPLNILNPIENTPFFFNRKITEEYFTRVASIFRFINPDSFIRLAGGRNLLNNFGENLFSSGVNATISGDLLTTYGNDTKSDLKIIKKLGYEV